MNTVFVGGSRRVSRLSPQVQERLNNITSSGAHVIVGDANGADKAVQKFLLNQTYHDVTIYCSGEACRNNLGQWQTRKIQAPKDTKGFDFYAAKDRAIACSAFTASGPAQAEAATSAGVDTGHNGCTDASAAITDGSARA